MKPVRLNLVALTGLGIAIAFTCASTTGPAHADTESGGFIWGAGSESGGAMGNGSATESGGEREGGEITESGGAWASDSSTESGGFHGGGESSESGGVAAGGEESESGFSGVSVGNSSSYVKNYKW